MGFNTTIVILNDGLQEISEDPQFGENLANAIAECGATGKTVTLYAYGKHCYGNVGEVIASRHSSETNYFKVWQNCGELLPANANCPDAGEARWSATNC